ncbi:isoprenoid synthase domain-containing protein [Lasiosphaeris hirsuta]|uniref:Isoprenoid synthase domain-containing protein n=1 Tax=Lasiosphaeris hirsuta TaxID=260670 RepID=A0AA40DNI2_9PEZI|nr:isoprenoid synthase domain-containing protein [Lasiosphaeris hirsuta]
MAWYSMWLFLWDDVVEDSAIPSAANTNTLRVEWLHEQALKYVEFHLGLSASAEEPPPPTKYCTLFKHAGAPLREACTVAERVRFYAALQEYMECCEVESAYVRRGELPSTSEYWEHRLGTSSVNTYSALGEYMSGGHIPEQLFDTPELKTMWFELNRHIVTMNDVVSLKKEIVFTNLNTLAGQSLTRLQGKSLHSLVPIVINETGADLDAVVASSIEILRISGENIDRMAERLLAMTEHDPQARASVEAYVGPFWTNLTGSYWWS